MQKLQRHCSLALQLLRSVRTTSSTAKIHLFLLPSRGKSGSKSTLSGSRKGDEICWQGSTSTKISCTKLSQVEFWSQNFGSKCHDWSKSLLLGNFIFWISPLFHFRKYSNNAYYINKKKSNTCLRAVWWRFRDLNTNESHFYEKEAIGHSFTGFCHTKKFFLPQVSRDQFV